MTPEKLFHELLGLGLNWEVVESRFERESGTVFLEIRETARLWESVRCPKDASVVFCYDHTEVLTWRHLNVFQHRCEITCRLPRGKCRQCGHVFRVRPPWEGLSTHFTKEFEAFALLLMREMPMSKVAEVVGETDTRLWRMLFRQVDAAYAEADFSKVCCVGVDEMSVRKGHEYISVFADLVRKRVLFATEGKDHAGVAGLRGGAGKTQWPSARDHPGEHGHESGLSEGGAGNLPECAGGVRQVSRHHECEPSGGSSAAGGGASGRGGRVGGAAQEPVAVAQEPGEPDGATKRRGWPRSTRKVCARPRRIRCGWCYRTSIGVATATVARQRFRVWCRWVRWVARQQPKNLLRSMVKVAEMVENHLAGILAHWKWGVTNAFMEGLNSVFSATKRKARGYRSTTHLITMLYFVAGKLRFPQF